MQLFATSPNLPQATPARPSRDSARASEPIEEVRDQTTRGDDARNRLTPDQPPEQEPEREQRTSDSENYRLNFDHEKRQIYLELLNPVTGDVIQRVPRDDLAFEFAPPEGAPAGGVNVTV